MKIAWLAAACLGILVTHATAADPLDFTLKAATGDASFRLSEQGDKLVALHFLLKTECPLCLKHTHDFMAAGAKTPDIVHVFVKPDTDAEIQAWAAKFDRDALKSTPIFRDPDAALAARLKIPGGYKFHGQTVRYPALIVLDSGGKEYFRYVGKSNSDRVSVDNFTAKAAEIQARRKSAAP